MDVAETWEQLRGSFVGHWYENETIRYSTAPDPIGWARECGRVIAHEGPPATNNIFWRSKHWPSAIHLRAVLDQAVAA